MFLIVSVNKITKVKGKRRFHVSFKSFSVKDGLLRSIIETTLVSYVPVSLVEITFPSNCQNNSVLFLYALNITELHHPVKTPPIPNDPCLAAMTYCRATITTTEPK